MINRHKKFTETFYETPDQSRLTIPNQVHFFSRRGLGIVHNVHNVNITHVHIDKHE